MIVMVLGLFSGEGLALASQDWPQFLGPNGNGSLAWPQGEAVLPPEGPKVEWRVDTGPGFGGAAIHGDKVFLLDRISKEEQDRLRVLALEDGKPLWDADYEAPGRLNFRGSRSVPVVTDSHVYTSGGMGHITAFDRRAQRIAWAVNVEKEMEGKRPLFGFSANLLLLEDAVVGAVLAKDVGLAAFDRESGKVLWKTQGVGYSHSSPVLVEIAGKPTILFQGCPTSASAAEKAVPSWIHGFDPKTGELLFRHETKFARLPIPAPIQIDAERFFFTAGYSAGSRLLKITKPGAEYVIEELFSHERGSQVHPGIHHGDFIYLLANENKNQSGRRRVNGGLMCLSLEGEEIWRTGDDPYFGLGAPLLLGDTLLIQDGDTGLLRSIAASSEGFELLGTFDGFGYEKDKKGQIWSPMAIKDGLLISRSQTELVCVSLGKP